MNSSKDDSSQNYRKSFGKKRPEMLQLVRDERPRLLRWVRLIRDLADAHSYLWIQERIKEANPPDDIWLVDDEKLQDLVTKGGSVRLTINQFVALDRFFSQFGEGIHEKGLFERSILEPTANAGSVRFLLGSSEDQGELWNVVRRWDSQAMAEILQEVTQINVRVKIEIADVIRNGADKRPDYPPQESFKSSGASLIAIGSPLANPASEVLLAEMLTVQPFQRSGEVQPPLPFHFIWPSIAAPSYPSTFSVAAQGDVLRRLRAYFKHLRPDHGVLRVNQPEPTKHGYRPLEKFYESVRLKESGKAPGVIVAQQRATGQVFMVVAGVSGPGTYAAGRCLTSHRTYSLPQPIGDHHGKVLVTYLQSQVTRLPHHHGDECDVAEPEILGSFAWPLH